ncbi:ABC transporter ATP-binding protein YojI [Serratia grimesii]|nr:ABC transporter ATP-binding protein YojI [Serratia grimesii]
MKFDIFMKFKWQLISCVLLSLISAFSIIKLISVINSISHGLVKQDLNYNFLAGVGVMVFLCIINVITQKILAITSSSLVSELRSRLSRKLSEIQYHISIKTPSSVFSVLIDDLNRVSALILLTPLFLYNFLIFFACFIYLYFISHMLPFLFFIFLLPPVILSVYFFKMTEKKFDVMRASEEALHLHYSLIQDAKQEMTINPGRSEHFHRNVLLPDIKISERLMKNVYELWGMNQALSPALIYGSVLIVSYVSSIYLNLQPQDIVSFTTIAFFMIGPLTFLLQSSQQISAGFGGVRHLRKIGIEIEYSEKTKKISMPHSYEGWRSISVSEVSYNYGGRGVKSTSFKINRGEVIFIVGDNGSGKSTIAKLLCGLLPSNSGTISVDGNIVDPLTTEYRSLFYCILDGFTIFNHVIDASAKSISDEEIYNWLKFLGLEKYVQSNNGILSNLDISTGQRKRIALLQCFAEERDIYVLDEFASDQSPGFRDFFYFEIIPLLKRKGITVIVISHDSDYFSVADKLITVS